MIAAITSCTNTSNPSLMLGAGLVAKKAVERGLQSKPWVKTSLAPGSKVVTDYLNAAGLTPYLEKLHFNLVGYGCTTCIGNSGPLPDAIGAAIKDNGLRGRVGAERQSQLRGAHSSAGARELSGFAAAGGGLRAGRPHGFRHGQRVAGQRRRRQARLPARHLADAQGSGRHGAHGGDHRDVPEGIRRSFQGDERWRGLPVPEGDLYAWDAKSTYIKRPPFFDDMPKTPAGAHRHSQRARAGGAGHSVTTDHISPAGSIQPDGPAGKYLIANGVKPSDFNSYGARRGNHEVMMRGTFANIRLRNLLAPGTEGGWTLHQPSGEKMTIYDAAMRYQQEGVPLVVLAGKEYGSGSSRDWAAKGTLLLGVRAVIAESYERIHRSNLVGMGVLPLEFLPGETAESLGLTGHETFTIEGVSQLTPRAKLRVRAREDQGQGKDLRGHRARGYAGRSRLLPARRDSAVRAAADALTASAEIRQLIRIRRGLDHRLWDGFFAANSRSRSSRQPSKRRSRLARSSNRKTSAD